MIRSKHNLIAFPLIPLGIFLFVLATISEVSSEEAKGVVNEPMVINSDSLEIDNKQMTVTFIGNVDARNNSFIINCQKMLLYYHNDKTAKDLGMGNIKIDKIVATGKVKINRIAGGVATSEKAIYYQDDERLVLTGKPVVKQGDDFVEGTKITLYLKEKRSIVEGSENKKVRVVLSPQNDKR